MATPRQQAMAGFIVGAVGIVAAAGMGVALVTDSGGDGDGDGSGAYQATEAGFIEEPAGEVGPDAFTPPVDTDDDQVCDKDKLVEELQNRPEAMRAWAAVLKVPEEDVPDYVETLEAQVLDSDTMVTNHGLHDGVAYARPSMLEEGTAVLIMGQPPQEINGDEPPPVETTNTTFTPDTTVTSGPSTTTVDSGTPVTRCKCGNPLLPPYYPSTPEEPTTTTTTTTTEPTEPGGQITTPTQPVTPTEPTEPTDPVTPSEPTEPTDPTDPNGPPPDSSNGTDPKDNSGL